MRLPIRRRRTVTGLSTMIWEDRSRPLLLDASIVIRKSGASSKADVIWQTITDPCSSGNTSLWTITAGRGFPKSPATATVMMSPRLTLVKFRNGLDPSECVGFLRSVQAGDRVCYPLPHLFRPGIWQGYTNLTLAWDSYFRSRYWHGGSSAIDWKHSSGKLPASL